MSWWQTLRQSRRLPPQTVEPIAVGDGFEFEMSELLGAWLRVAFSESEDAEQREGDALARLRAEPDRALSEIVMTCDRAREHDYPLRWALVYCAGQLGVADSLGFLEGVLESEIPPERSNDIHLFSTVAEETSLRCQAVRGMSYLASTGDNRARASLLAQLSHPSYTVRVIACQVLRELTGDDEIRKRLPSEEAEAVLAIRQVSVDELEPLLAGAAQVRAPRPPGGESGTELDVRAAQPPTVARSKERNG